MAKFRFPASTGIRAFQKSRVPDRQCQHAADREERLRLCRMVETAAEEDDVNTINGRVAGQRIQLRERTAEKIFPSDEVSAVFRKRRCAWVDRRAD